MEKYSTDPPGIEAAVDKVKVVPEIAVTVVVPDAMPAAGQVTAAPTRILALGAVMLTLVELVVLPVVNAVVDDTVGTCTNWLGG